MTAAKLATDAVETAKIKDLNVTTGKLAANAVTDAKLRQGAAKSVIGVTGNATADVADIAAASADHVLRVNAANTGLAFGTVAAGGLASDSVTTAKILDSNVTAAKLASDAVTTVKVLDANITYAKIQNGGALSVAGRSANSAGVMADISASAASGAVLRESGSTIGFGTVAAAGLASDSVTTVKILDANVTMAKIENGSARSLIGRAANSAGVNASIQGGGAGTYFNDNATSIAARAMNSIIQDLAISGDISPAQLTADQNDWDPASLATAAVIRVDTDATRTVTGLAGGADGRVIFILNVGSNSLVLADGSVSSAAANRFALGADRTLTTKQGILLWYDSTSSLWRATDQAPGAAGGGAPTDATYLTLTTNGTLSNERVLTASTRVTITDAGAGSTATLDLGTNSVGDTYLRQGAARSVIGVTGNATANVADIAGTADQVLRVNAAGTALAFGTVAAGGIASDAVTTAKILNSNVTLAKIVDASALSVLGRSANSTGVYADIAAGTDGDILRRKGTALGFGRALPVVVTLTDAATISVDASLIGIGDSFTVTLGGNRTVGAPSNPTNGQWMCIAVVQDGTGSRTLGFTTGAAGFRATELSLTQTLSTAAGKIDYFLFRYHSGDNRWDLMDFRKAA